MATVDEEGARRGVTRAAPRAQLLDPRLTPYVARAALADPADSWLLNLLSFASFTHDFSLSRLAILTASAD